MIEESDLNSICGELIQIWIDEYNVVVIRGCSRDAYVEQAANNGQDYDCGD